MIDDRIVDHVARLSRLDLSDEERARFRAQLGSILDYVQTLKALDLADVPPTAHALAVTNVMREDVPGPCLDRDEALANAPRTDNGFVVVPPVIEPE
jgi:aspartyl-tRNA(Asn)/glutamyl-tRNA(Gln) amidotransferase subunit C